MSNILALIASFFLSVQTLITPSVPANIKSLKSKESVNVCLNAELVKKGIDPEDLKVPKVLKNIKKTDRMNTTAGYEIPECRNNGACDGPDSANYRLIATNIKLDHTIFPNSFIDGEKLSDRQMVKQTDITNDKILADRYKNRIYRTFCGDWCYTCKPADVRCLDDKCLKVECDTTNPPWVLPFQGSYHCNFVFYLQDKDDTEQLQMDKSGNLAQGFTSGTDPNIPKDNTLYSVYFREGADLPPDITCSGGVKADEVVPTPIIKNIGPLLNYPTKSDNYWRIDKNPDSPDGSFQARNSEIINFKVKETQQNPAGLTGSYDMIPNLMDPGSSNLMYLVPHDSISEFPGLLNADPPIIKLFSYFKFIRWNDSARQKSLKLGTFPFNTDWIKDWVKESKPAIYLYPQKSTAVNVKLAPKGYLTVSDPPYNPLFGWNIIANPDGTITQLSTTNYQPSTLYPYLYYEADISEKPDPKVGFVLKNSELSGFLDNTLLIVGLNNKELMDFKEYWLPRLTAAKINYWMIYLLNSKEIERIEPINISMPVDTSIRIRLYFKPLNSYIIIPKQILTPAPIRSGNTMVEWGGILDTVKN